MKEGEWTRCPGLNVKESSPETSGHWVCEGEEGDRVVEEKDGKS